MNENTPSAANPPVSRRNFLTNTSIGATAAWTIVKPESVRGSAANSAVSVGLLGTGGRGSRVAGYAQANTRGRVIALCDLFDEQIENAKKKIEVPDAVVYKDMDKFLSADDIDAVIIATPPFEHPRMLSAAVQAGKHIYCEKPMGVDAEGCRLVIEASAPPQTRQMPLDRFSAALRQGISGGLSPPPGRRARQADDGRRFLDLGRPVEIPALRRSRGS